MLPDLNRVAVMQNTGEDRHAVDIRAVAALQVFQDKLIAVARDACVAARNAFIGEDGTAGAIASEHHLVPLDADVAPEGARGPGQHADPAQGGPWARDHPVSGSCEI